MINLVISHYKNNLNWINNLKQYNELHIIIHSKNPDVSDTINGIKIIKRPNAGREGETYINYIIQNYCEMKPNDYTIFCQDDPFEHQPNFLELLDFLIKLYRKKKKLPLIQPLNSHAYQDIKKDMDNKDKIVSGDIFSYNEYKQKKKEASKIGKKFFNNYPAKKLNEIKTHSIFDNNKQIAQINIDYINLNLESILLPDANPFIWHLYKGISNYLKIKDLNELLNNKLTLLVYLIYIYMQDNKIPKDEFDRILNLKYIAYNPSAQFLISHKIILQNKLYIYQNIQNLLLDPSQPILPQKVRLNGFVIEFLWMHIFKFDQYYKNYFAPKEQQFYLNKNGDQKYIKYFQKYWKNKIKIQKMIILNYTKDSLRNAYKISKLLKYIENQKINERMQIIIDENKKMLQVSNYKFYGRI